MRGFRRLLRCVFNPYIGVVALVTFFTVGDGKLAGGAVVVADGVGVYQTTGSSFGNAGDTSAVGDNEIKGCGVSKRDAVCIDKAAGGQFLNRMDTAVSISKRY